MRPGESRRGLMVLEQTNSTGRNEPSFLNISYRTSLPTLPPSISLHGFFLLPFLPFSSKHVLPSVPLSLSFCPSLFLSLPMPKSLSLSSISIYPHSLQFTLLFPLSFIPFPFHLPKSSSSTPYFLPSPLHSCVPPSFLPINLISYFQPFVILFIPE